MSGEQRRADSEARRVQIGSEVSQGLGCVAEAVQQEHRGIAASAKLDGLRTGNQAGDRASWLRWITYDEPLRSATPEPTSLPSASEMDSRVAPTISHNRR